MLQRTEESGTMLQRTLQLLQSPLAMEPPAGTPLPRSGKYTGRHQVNIHVEPPNIHDANSFIRHAAQKKHAEHMRKVGADWAAHLQFHPDGRIIGGAPELPKARKKIFGKLEPIDMKEWKPSISGSFDFQEGGGSFSMADAGGTWRGTLTADSKFADVTGSEGWVNGGFSAPFASGNDHPALVAMVEELRARLSRGVLAVDITETEVFLDLAGKWGLAPDKVSAVAQVLKAARSAQEVAGVMAKLNEHLHQPWSVLSLPDVQTTIDAMVHLGCASEEELQSLRTLHADVTAARATAGKELALAGHVPLAEIDVEVLQQKLLATREMGGADQAALSVIEQRRAIASTLERPMLALLDRAKLGDKVGPLLLKHNVHTLCELAGWQPQTLKKLFKISDNDASTLVQVARTEAQLTAPQTTKGGQQLALTVTSYSDVKGYTEYLVQTTAISADGRQRKEFRAPRRVTSFREFHEQIKSMLAPHGVPNEFPLSKSWRIFQTESIKNKRMAQLEGYLKTVLRACKAKGYNGKDGGAAMPPNVAAFLGLPAGGVVFASSAPTAALSTIAPDDWDMPSSKLNFVRELGQGGFGTVYEVRMGGASYAAKKIPCTVESERKAVVTMVRREFRALMKLQHPNIVALIGVVTDDPKSISLLMELAPRGSLRSVLDHSAAEVVGKLSTQRHLLHGICAGMAWLHGQRPSPMLHHDLKSDNVLVWPTDGLLMPKLTDFGMATGTGLSKMSLRTTKAAGSKTGAGTLAYKAPECYEDKFTTASEVYAFAITAWEVLTAQMPWEGKTETSLTMSVAVKKERPPLPEAAEGGCGVLVPIIERCWAHEPRDRPSFPELCEMPELQPRAKGMAAGDSASAGDAALAEKVDASLQMMQQVLKGQRDLGAQVAQMAVSVSANSNMLGALLQGEHDCPRWLVVVPKQPAKGAAQRTLELFKPKNWLNKTVVLYFLCPISMRAVGEGFEMQLPRDWVKKYGPAIRVGLTMLKLGAACARLAGLQMPNLGDVEDAFDLQRGYIREVVDGVEEALASEGMGKVCTWVKDTLEVPLEERGELSKRDKGTEALAGALACEEAEEALQRSYGEVRALLDSLEPKSEGWEAKVRQERRCGLQKAVHTESGSFEWVATEWKAAYEKHGSALLGRSEADLEQYRHSSPQVS